LKKRKTYKTSIRKPNLKKIPTPTSIISEKKFKEEKTTAVRNHNKNRSRLGKRVLITTSKSMPSQPLRNS